MLIGLFFAGAVLSASLLVTAPWRFSVVLTFVALVTLTWIEFRSVGGSTLSDPFLVGGVAATAVARRRWTTRTPIDLAPQRDFLSYAAVLTVGGIIGGLVSGGTRAGYVDAAQFVVAVVLVSYLVSAHAVDVRSWERLVSWFVAGSLVSAVVAHFPSNRTEYLGRGAGLASHPNHLALVMMLACGFAAALLASDRPATRYLGWIALPVMLNALVWSGSRAGLAGLLVGALALAVFSRANGIATLSVGVVAGVAVLLTTLARDATNSASAIDRLLRPGRTEQESNEGRWEYLQDAIDLIQRKPITGRGFDEALRVHSVPLQFVVMAGLLGVLALVILVRFGLRAARWASRPNSPWRVRAMASSLAGLGMFWIVTNALFDRYLLLAISLIAAGLASGAGTDRTAPSSTGLNAPFDQRSGETASTVSTAAVAHQRVDRHGDR